MKSVRMGLIAALMCAALPFLMGTVFLPEIESEGFFTAEETSVIRDLCRAMSLKHGYSFELELDYISPDGKAQAALTSADPRFYEVVDASNIEVSKTLFIKLYRLYRQTECQVNRYSYKDPRNFKRYSALYLESIKTVAIGMEDALCKKDVFLRADFQARKAAIDREEALACFLTEEEGEFFNSADREILDATLHAIDYEHGYDSEIQLAYIFAFSHSETITPPREKEFHKVVSKVDPVKLLSFYEKLFKLVKITEKKTREYHEQKKWVLYTYLSKKLTPSLTTYFALFEKSVLLAQPKAKGELAERQGRVMAWLNLEYRFRQRIVETFEF
ncbi:MAG TPA: hypothetical protein PKM65_14980 [Spirochaetota bacterium]|nr:hypothetical protein [Spirochaetota bacterium]HNT10462.1 hypothetical protein [Spirochaetota bacterium]HNV48120.1 hypothetical protein [Spirochaetota bacterium]HPI22339.1 hypothetical protein [Spirochaetota bacterium]HPU87024.1 hypothetical protein [Spirochaetota bacterium]